MQSILKISAVDDDPDLSKLHGGTAPCLHSSRGIGTTELTFYLKSKAEIIETLTNIIRQLSSNER